MKMPLVSCIRRRNSFGTELSTGTCKYSSTIFAASRSGSSSSPRHVIRYAIPDRISIISRGLSLKLAIPRSLRSSREAIADGLQQFHAAFRNRFATCVDDGNQCKQKRVHRQLLQCCVRTESIEQIGRGGGGLGKSARFGTPACIPVQDQVLHLL